MAATREAITEGRFAAFAARMRVELRGGGSADDDAEQN